MNNDLTKPRFLPAALIPLVFIGLLFTAACSEPEIETEIEDDLELLYFETIAMGQTGSIRDTLEIIVRDSLEWIEVRKQVSPLVPFKPVDFSQGMVGLIALRTEYGGFGVEVEAVEKVDETIIVTYVVAIPDSDCISLAADALPFQAIMIRRSAGDVQFIRRTRRFECTF